jgi:hypothetical protein
MMLICQYLDTPFQNIAAKNKNVSMQDHNKFLKTLEFLQVEEGGINQMVYIFIYFVHFKDVVRLFL